MKNIGRYIIIILMLVSGFGCADFLEEYSQDEIVPSTADDLDQLLIGEAYPIALPILSYLDLLTDDVESNFPPIASQYTCLLTGASVFSWQRDMFEQLPEKTQTPTNTWEYYYARIKGCNVVLDNIDAAIGDVAKKGNVKGQALSMRAYYHFMLVNLFAQPYNAEGVDISKAPGIPLMLSSAVKDEFPKRNTIAQVYAQIEKDLLEAVPLMDKYGRNNNSYRANYLFTRTLLARMYLYMERWEKVIEHAGFVISEKPILRNLSDVVTATGVYNWMTVNNVMDVNSPEMIWRYSRSNEFNPFFVSYSAPVAFQASEELKDLYDKDRDEVLKDLRLTCFYRTYSFNGTTRIQYGQKAGSGTSKGMRVAESYLNRAEANARLYLENGNDELRKAALSDLNYLRSCRFDTRTLMYRDIDITDKEKLLEFCLEERRRELNFEEHRWFDLRRNGMPQLTHILTIEAGQPVTYTLEEKSSKYTLPIPQYILDRNPNLEPNL